MVLKSLMVYLRCYLKLKCRPFVAVLNYSERSSNSVVILLFKEDNSSRMACFSSFSIYIVFRANCDCSKAIFFMALKLLTASNSLCILVWLFMFSHCGLLSISDTSLFSLSLWKKDRLLLLEVRKERSVSIHDRYLLLSPDWNSLWELCWGC